MKTLPQPSGWSGSQPLSQDELWSYYSDLFPRSTKPTTRKPSSMALENLPCEVLAEIAIYVEHDQDLVNLMLTCQRIRAVIDHPRSNVWRARFRRHYDLPSGLDTAAVHQKYIRYRANIPSPTWETFYMTRERAPPLQKFLKPGLLQAILDLVTDSYRNQVRPWMCKNLKYLENLATLFPALSFSILDPDVPEKKFARVSVIQMALFHEILRYSVSHPCRSHIWRRLLQTCFGHPEEHSLIEVHAGWKLHEFNVMCLLDFFRVVLTGKQGDYSAAYSQLEQFQRPGVWFSAFTNELKPLGKYWRGTSAWLPHGSFVLDCRRGEKARIFDRLGFDTFGGPLEDGFNLLCLDFDRSHQPQKWIDAFEWSTESIPTAELVFLLKEGRRPTPEDKTGPARRGRDYLPFVGQDSDVREYLLAGNMHGLPAQEGVKGFRRVAFIKYPRPAELPDATNPPIFTKRGELIHWHYNLTRSETSPHGAEDAHCPPADLGAVTLADDCWLYDGIVLPGGRVMVGRWYKCVEEPLDATEVPRQPGDQLNWFEMWNCGPFIYWCID